MAKRKDSASLFEVVTKGAEAQKGLHVPDWAEAHGPPPELAATPPAPPRPAKPLKQPPGLVPIAPGAVATSPAPMAPAEPIAQIAPGRLRLSLSYFSCAVIALAVLVLIAGAYMLGVKAGSRPAPPTGPEIAGTTGLRPDGEVSWQAIQAEGRAKLRDGRQYLVVQDGIATIAEAQAVQKYLYSRWIEAPVILGTQPPYAVMSTKDYTDATQEQKDGARKNVEELGRRAEWDLRNKYDFKHSVLETYRGSSGANR